MKQELGFDLNWREVDQSLELCQCEPLSAQKDMLRILLGFSAL